MATKSKLEKLKAKFDQGAGAFNPIDKSRINLINPPFAIRNDCQIGQWKVGDADLLGNELEIAILKVYPAEGTLGKTTGKWQQVWFVGSPREQKLPRNICCVTYIKGISSATFGNKIIGLLGDEKVNPNAGFWKLGFEKHSGEKGLYYSLKFDWAEASEDVDIDFLELVADFNLSDPFLVDTNLPDTISVSSIDAVTELRALEQANVVKLTAAA